MNKARVGRWIIGGGGRPPHGGPLCAKPEGAEGRRALYGVPFPGEVRSGRYSPFFTRLLVGLAITTRTPTPSPSGGRVARKIRSALLSSSDSRRYGDEDERVGAKLPRSRL
jgi:hypothetical protein